MAEGHDEAVLGPEAEPEATYDLDEYISENEGEEEEEVQGPEFPEVLPEGESVWACDWGAWYAKCPRFSPV